MIRIAFITTMWFALLASPAIAQKSEAKVKVKTSSTKPDDQGRQTITLELTIEPEWYIYANPVENDAIVSAQTKLTIRSKSMLQNTKVEYPNGELKIDEDDKYYVYQGKVTIQATVQRPQNDANPLNLTLQVNACRNKACLPTGKFFIDVP